jgi:hypothetical protein
VHEDKERNRWAGARDKQEAGKKLAAPYAFFLRKPQGAANFLLFNNILINKLLVIG